MSEVCPGAAKLAFSAELFFGTPIPSNQMKKATVKSALIQPRMKTVELLSCDCDLVEPILSSFLLAFVLFCMGGGLYLISLIFIVSFC